ncbi:MAG: cytochrome-c peroxidase [Candidatus Marinimicrobia bacterium]|nr:cytochrome-c peroxidase [Candidatus Neomarinimicrobiota bacterium]
MYKKIILFSLIIGLLFPNYFGNINNQTNQVETEMPGDVNDDGIVDVLDLVLIVNFILGQGSLAVESAGDFNYDGIIDILDLVSIVGCIMGTGPCESINILEIPQYVTDYHGEMPIPEDNPLSEAGIELGRFLFYDKKLSDDGTQSCASCHLQENGFTDPNQFSEGITGELGGRNAMQIINAAWFTSFFWDGRAESLEAQAFGPVVNPVELNTTWPAVEERVAADPMYPPMFEEVFGSSMIDSVRISKAISQFERSLLSFNSKYDNFFYGDFTGFNESEESGFDIYFSEVGDCIHCHQGPILNDNEFRNNGLDSELTDLGLGEVTGDPLDFGKFKVPTLRNIEFTGPYMHDGRFETLEEVVEHYNSGVHSDSPNLDPEMENAAAGLNLTEQQKTDLVNFLKTFSDTTFLSNPAFADPFEEE